MFVVAAWNATEALLGNNAADSMIRTWEQLEEI